MSSPSSSYKLSDESTQKLRSDLLEILSPSPSSSSADSEENVSDLVDFILAMVGNSKSVDFITQELTSMQMDECDEEKSKSVGELIQKFISVSAAAEEAIQERVPEDSVSLCIACV